MDLNKKNITIIMKLITFTVILCFVLANIGKLIGLAGYILGLFMPLLFGAALAFVLNVPLGAWEDKVFGKWKTHTKVKRPISIALTIISVLLVLCFISWMVIPQLVDAGESMAKQLPQAIENGENFLKENVTSDTTLGTAVQRFGEESEKYVQQFVDMIKNGSGKIVSTTFDFLSGTFGAIVNGLIGFVFAIYILAAKEQLIGQIKRVMYVFLPEKISVSLMKVCRLANDTFRNFVTGQCLEAIILATIFFITLSIFRMPYALPISVLIMLTSLIPVLGSFIGCTVGVVLMLVVSPIQALWFLILFVIIQQIDGNLIYPHVVGGSVGLPSIWVFVAVVLGGKLFGVIGMLLFIPICSVIYVLFRDEVRSRLKEMKSKKA